MERFIQSFMTSGDVQTAIDNKELGKPYVAFVTDEEYIDWNTKTKTPPLSAQPLTFEIISADTITFIRNSKYALTGYVYGPELTVEYSLNDGPWIAVTSTTGGTNIPVTNGDKIKFRGNNLRYTSNASNVFFANTQFKVKGQYKAYGNIASLINSNDYINQNEFQEYALFRFFSDETGLTEVTELAFGNNIYVSPLWHMYCFRELFNNCSNLSFIKTVLGGITKTISQMQNWVNGVASTGTFVKHPDSSWPTGTNGIPAGWTVINADI